MSISSEVLKRIRLWMAAITLLSLAHFGLYSHSNELQAARYQNRHHATTAFHRGGMRHAQKTGHKNQFDPRTYRDHVNPPGPAGSQPREMIARKPEAATRS